MVFALTRATPNNTEQHEEHLAIARTRHQSVNLLLFQVIKLKPSGDEFTYFLHYIGWNRRWDKWVVESDLMAAGPEALETQKQLKEKQKKDKVGSTRPCRIVLDILFQHHIGLF